MCGDDSTWGQMTDLSSPLWTQPGTSPTLEGPFHLLLSQLLLWSCCHPGWCIPQCTACTQMMKFLNNLSTRYMNFWFRKNSRWNAALCQFIQNNYYWSLEEYKSWLKHALKQQSAVISNKICCEIWLKCLILNMEMFGTLTDVRGRPMRTAGSSLAGGHGDLLPHLGIWVQTSTLWGDLKKKRM